MRRTDIVCLAVLQHVAKQRLPGVLARMAAALRDGGGLLVAVRTGEGERWEVGDSGNPYYVALWGETEFMGLLEGVGLRVVWRDSEDSDWLWVLATRC